MTREIKFRGLRKDNNGWVYGLYEARRKHTGSPIRYFIAWDNGEDGFIEEIHPESVGQFTGLKDKNGKDIYEGDILGKDSVKCIVVFNKDYAGFETEPLWNMWSKGKMEVIGNIHQNLELTTN